VRRIVKRHEIFSTTFQTIETLKLPLQEVKSDAALYCVEEISATEFLYRNGLPEGLAIDRQEQAIIDKLFDFRQWNAFDLQNGPLLKLSWIRLAEDRALLLIQLSSLWGDAAALQILVKLLVSYLNSSATFAGPEQTPIQYPDFCEWQNDLLEDEETRAGREYWEKRSPLNSLALAAAKDGAAFTPARVRVTIEPGVSRAILDLSAKNKIPVSMFPLCCLGVLLQRLENARDFRIGVFYEGRKYAGLDQVIGLLGSFLPLEWKWNSSSSFFDLARFVNALAEENYEWQEYYGGLPDESFFPFCYE